MVAFGLGVLTLELWCYFHTCKAGVRFVVREGSRMPTGLRFRCRCCLDTHVGLRFAKYFHGLWV